MLKNADAAAPRDTGRLAASARIERSRGNAALHYDAPYAAIQDARTRFLTDAPNADALAALRDTFLNEL